MKIVQGRPADTAHRQEKELRVYDLLDSLGIAYLHTDHAAAMTMEACREVDEAMGTPMCKNLLLCNRQQTDFYLLMLPGDKVFKTSVLSRQIGSSRLSFAQGEYMERYLDITPGSLSVMGLMNDRAGNVRLLIDADVLAMRSVCCHPCVNTSSILLSTEDLMTRFLPAVNHEATVVTLPSGE